MGVKFMECYYHPDREGTDTCAICGKSICKECGLEIAGKEYCKEDRKSTRLNSSH